LPSFGRYEGVQYFLRALVRLGIQLEKSTAPLCGQREHNLASVAARPFSRNQAGVGEILQDPAQVSRIEGELLADRRRVGDVARAEFVEDARFGEGKPGVLIAFVERSDVLRVEAIEPPECGDGGGSGLPGRGGCKGYRDILEKSVAS
jgi:hypothetical protein